MTDESDEIAVLLVAAGRGTRFGSGVPKQYHLLGTASVLAATIKAFATHLPRAKIWTVINADDRALYEATVAGLSANLAAPVFGGATRQASVFAGLAAMAAQPPRFVLIHDGVRPAVSQALMLRAIACAKKHGAGVPGLAVTDTIKQVDATGKIVDTPNRALLRSVQTPQAFAFKLIYDAHRNAATAGHTHLTDDAALASLAGHDVHIFEGDARNMKITTPEDLPIGATDAFASRPDIRTGQGFDVHAFGPGDHVWLGGVQMAHTHALIGHSDADVLLHAITDAVLGALADGDIGAHFPPTDQKWQGAASALFLRDALARLAARGGVVAHIDATLICETPKIGPLRDKIRASIAAITGLALDKIAVKATTSERLGFTGRSEGIAAMAIATVRLPAS